MLRRFLTLDSLYYLLAFLFLFFVIGLAEFYGVGDKIKESIREWLSDSEDSTENPL